MNYKAILLMFILLVPLVQAADTDQALTWLSEQSKPTISSLAFSIMATDALRPSDATGLKTELNSRKSVENCWPLGACSVKDTSLALLALKQSPSSNTWLISKQQKDSEGKWVLQIETSGQGTCTVGYLNRNALINVNQGWISSTACTTPTTLFDLNNCIAQDLISSNEKVDFTITCSNLGNSIISAAYNLGSTYIPIGDSSASLSKSIKIRNTYFLDFESTLYANWAFKQSNQDPPSLVWLKKSYNSDSIEQNALLYLITEDNSYIQQLLEKQSEEGNFGSLYETALAVYALRKDNQEQAAIASAMSWLDSQQSPEGSWAGSVADTAAVLFGAYSPVSAVPSTVIEPEKKITEICRDTGFCETEWGETAANCPVDCSCGDSICDGSESKISCPADCGEPEPESVCGDEICDIDETEETCPEDCKQTSYFWIILILFIIVIAVLIYFYYTQFYKKGRNLIAELKGIFTKIKKPKQRITQEQIQMPRAQSVRPVSYPLKITSEKKSNIEKELEKSIAEAKKILKK